MLEGTWNFEMSTSTRKLSLIVSAPSFMYCSRNTIQYLLTYCFCLPFSPFSSFFFLHVFTHFIPLGLKSADSLSLTWAYGRLQAERSVQTAKVRPEGFGEMTRVTCVSEQSREEVNIPN